MTNVHLLHFTHPVQSYSRFLLLFDFFKIDKGLKFVLTFDVYINIIKTYSLKKHTLCVDFISIWKS